MEKIIQRPDRNRTGRRGTRLKTPNLKSHINPELNQPQYLKPGKDIIHTSPGDATYKRDSEDEATYSTWFIAGHNRII